MDQLRKLISGLSLFQRISIVAVAALVVGGLAAFSHMRHEADFRPLYTAMAPEDAATVVQKLKESAVEYHLADNGGTVLVPSGKLAESRLALAAAGLPKSGRIGFELFDKNNFGATEFVEHINYKRALEGELERSVMSLAEVEQARVHLTLPKESVFLDQQEPAKASVMVKLRAGAQISPQNVTAVTNLVASAVEGLAPEAVSLVDMDGRLLSKPRKAAANDGSEITAESLEVRQQIERALVTKIDATLEPLLGANRFRAGASVDCDLTSGEQQEETLDPTKSVMLSSQKTEEGADRPVSGGVPGTASNLPAPANNTPNKTSNGIARRTENITYQTSRLVKTTRIPQGMVRRMSLAVLVDQTVQWESDGAARKKVLVPPTPETLKTIRDLVAGVTGFNEERGDQLIVESLPFESSLNAQPPVTARPTGSKPAVKEPPLVEFYNKYRDLTLPASLGLMLLLALAFAILRMVRKPGHGRDSVEEQLELPPGSDTPPASLPGAEGAAAHLELSAKAQQLAAVPQLSEGERDQLAERIRVVAKRDPAATANVLRMWLQDNQT